MISTRITKRVFVSVIDFLILSLSLYISLCIRKIEIISYDYFLEIFYPFLIIIFISIIVFYMYGLYDKMTVKIYKELNQRILSGQIISSILGSIVFYSSSYFSIAPKTILIIYILISSLLIFVWRRYARHVIKGNKDVKILIVAEGDELLELRDEILNNKILNVKKVDVFDLSQNNNLDLYTKIKNNIKEEGYNMLVINMHNSYIKNQISLFYELLLEGVSVVNFADLYEEVLQKIPLKNIDAGWFFNNLYNNKTKFYQKTKRFIDLSISIPAFLLSLIFYPFIYLAIKIQDGGSVFYTAERVGKDNKVFKIYKFRSMTNKKVEDIDVASKSESGRVTKFGKFIRKTRIDELPQLINVIMGDLSLIGPRPEFPQLVKEYSNQIPFYGIRHTIVPGLSGYAQIYQEQHTVPKFGIATDSTKIKLSYDVYYLKHRSLVMDISLIIRTVRILIGKTGL